MKHCNTCSSDKDESEFNKRTSSRDGLSPRCRQCQRVYDKARAKDPHRIAARAIYAQTEEGQISGAKAKSAWRARNPRKAKAHAVVSRQIRAGNLYKQSCEVCGESSHIHAHHDDYLKPLNVRWLCSVHHHQWHAEHGEAKNP